MSGADRKDSGKSPLLATLDKVGGGLKDGPSRRTVIIVGIVLLVALLIGLVLIINSVSDKRNSKRWAELQNAGSPDALGDLLDKNKNTMQGRAARLQVAREELAEGLRTIYTTRSSAVEKLRSAASAFETLARELKTSPIVVQECLFGAGQAREALGEYDEAIALYRDLDKRYADSALAKKATERVKDIEKNRKELDKLQAQLKKQAID